MVSLERQFRRAFHSTGFSVFYRRMQPLSWQNRSSRRFSLLFPLDGQLSYTCNGTPKQLAPSHFIIFEPDISILTTGANAHCLLVSLAPALLAERGVAMHLIRPKSAVTLRHDQIRFDQEIRPLMADLVGELTVENLGKEIVICALLERLSVYILRNYLEVELSNELELDRLRITDARIRRAVDLMHSQMDQDLPLKTLAAASYLSPYHFARTFKKVTGFTPRSYLTRIRAMRARSLLAETNLSVSEIGAQVGYLSVSHFTKAFRLATGSPPRKYRDSLIESKSPTS